MKNIPQEIYLQIDADGQTPEDFNELTITWCTDQIFDNDLKYVHVSQLEYLNNQIAALKSELTTKEKL